MLAHKKILSTAMMGFLIVGFTTEASSQISVKPKVSSAGKITKKPAIRSATQLTKCKNNAPKKSLQISLKSSINPRLTVSNAKIDINRIDENGGIHKFRAGQETFGGKLRVSGLCPGRYVAYAYGKEAGNVINSGGLRFLQGQKSFNAPAQARNFSISLRPVEIAVRIHKVTNFDRFRSWSNDDRVQTNPAPLGPVNNVGSRDHEFSVQCCKRITVNIFNNNFSVTQTRSFSFTPAANGPRNVTYDVNMTPLATIRNWTGRALTNAQISNPNSLRSEFPRGSNINIRITRVNTTDRNLNNQVQSPSPREGDHIRWGGQLTLRVYRSN